MYGRSSKILVWALTSALITIAGCSRSDIGQPVAHLRGWAFTDEPVAGASVRIYAAGDSASDRAADEFPETAVTEAQGSFLLPVYRLPSSFRIAVVDGTYRGAALDAELRAEVRDLDPGKDFIYVNVVTTMVSAYLDRHPGQRLDTALAAVKTFLDIPEGVEVGASLHNSERYFSHIAFMAEAAQSGGVNALITALIDQLDADPSTRHPFYSTELFSDETSPIVEKILDQIAQGALSAAGGKVFGWALKLFGAGGDSGGADLREVQKTLEQIKTMLSELSSQMSRLYDQLSAQITQTDYNIRIGQIAQLINTIRTTSDSLAYLTSLTPSPENKGWIDYEKNRIRDIIGQQLLPQASVISDQLIGTAGAEGLIKTWSRVVKNRHRFLGPTDSKQMQAQFDYFDAIQLSLLGLVVEYHHATEAPGNVIVAAIDKYKSNRSAQLGLKARPIPDGALMETRSGIMLYPLDVWNAYNYTRQDFVPWGCRAGATIYFTFFIDSRNSQVSYNFPPGGKPLLGFSNWRMPTRSEGQKLFELWVGDGVGTWAVAQGYPSGFIDNKMKIFLFEGGSSYEMIEGRGRYFLSTANGAISSDPNPYGAGVYCYGEEGGHLIPVRSLAEGELYYW